jgi:LPXTG-motif cell wall-anchored protein
VTTNPNKIKVCELSSKHVITIATNDFDSTKHSKNLDDCKSVEEEKCTVPGKETMPADSPDCKNDVVTPAELPHTGITDGLVSVLGAGSLVGMAGAFAASRRALKQN